jgi:hypothetical protein
VIGFAAAAAAFASGAVAAPFTATLQTPLTQHLQLVRNDTVWVCAESQCQANTTSIDTDSWQACRNLARRVGPISAYGDLDAKALAKCNEGVTAAAK